ncbi:hypothetical protein [Radiobacillus sp. PE A8.2]|uniref:hypothetical protein n=1 Tax=Radiobacillus sp. PE A8.2 TaxID=3380349 RepID=UPI00388E04F0
MKSINLQCPYQTLTFDVKTNRDANSLVLQLTSEATIYETKINGKAFTPNTNHPNPDNWFNLDFYTGTEDHFEFSITVGQADSLDFILFDRINKLPVDLNRPENTVTYGDYSFVGKQYSF